MAAQRHADRRRDRPPRTRSPPPTSTAGSPAASPPPASPTRRRAASPSSRRRTSCRRASTATRASAPTLTCTRGDWDDPATPYAVTYQWYRGGTAIPDATNATYTVTAAEATTYVQCRVRAEDFTTANSPLAYITTQATGGTPVNLIAPAISGDRRLRRTLDLQPRQLERPAPTPYPVTYRWRRGSVAIPGADRRAATRSPPTTSASRSTARSRPTALTTATSPSTTPTNPELIVAPAITGDPRLRQTLSCSRGTWHDDATDRYTVTYRWLRNSTAITGATADTYTLTPADVGTSIDCEARAENLTAAALGGGRHHAPRATCSARS